MILLEQKVSDFLRITNAYNLATQMKHEHISVTAISHNVQT